VFAAVSVSGFSGRIIIEAGLLRWNNLNPASSGVVALGKGGSVGFRATSMTSRGYIYNKG
jgi:hypothetical protein